jgi:hypothetical protein
VGAALDAGSIAGLTRSLDSGAAPHDCTPPWPRQAPERLALVKDVPSLQVAVTVPVLCAWAMVMDSNSPAIKATDNTRCRVRPTPFPLFIAIQLPLGHPNAPRLEPLAVRCPILAELIYRIEIVRQA